MKFLLKLGFHLKSYQLKENKLLWQAHIKHIGIRGLHTQVQEVCVPTQLGSRKMPRNKRYAYLHTQILELYTPTYRRFIYLGTRCLHTQVQEVHIPCTRGTYFAALGKYFPTNFVLIESDPAAMRFSLLLLLGLDGREEDRMFGMA